MILLNLIEGVSSWAELETRISSLPSEMERGEAFEEFCKVFFLLDPVFQFENVYRQSEIPSSLSQAIGYPGGRDIGIDGLAVTTEGKVVAYQAKFRKDRTNIPTLRELSTFFTVSDRADWRITITNANSLPSSINNRTNHSRVLSDRLDQLNLDFFNRLRIYLEKQRIIPITANVPHQTQQEAIDAALSYFKDHNRGQLILPCGTGKTLAAMWIAEKIGSLRILVMVPSLALMSQTLREWAANTSIKPFTYLCLCSDTTVDLGNDSPIEHLYEMDISVTTDANMVSDFLSNKPSITSILFSTYQSSKVLSEAVLRTGIIFDVGIFDEAHRTTGTKVGVWNLALDDERIPIKKRIFMTATPRIYVPHIIKKAKEEDLFICSMDDQLVYGNPFYEMTFGEAIKRGLITDYKIVVICVTDSEVKDIIEQGGRIITDDEHEWDAKAFAKRVALAKGINAYGLKKVFTFHGRVKGAKAFTDTNTPYGIHQILKMLDPDKNNKKEIKFFHINGAMPAGVRNSIMKEFKRSEIGIISNSRCLTEGVDVPAVDTVAFIDPKRSLIDIVQATGRAMRKAEWKEKGYIFIPVVVEGDDDPAKFIESSDFAAVWQVLQAMVDQDQRLNDIVSNLRVMQGKGEAATQAWKDAMAEFTERIEFFNLPNKIDRVRFINALNTKTVEIIGRAWDFWYGLTVIYKNQFGQPNAPQNYKTNKGYRLGAWQNNQRRFYKLGKLVSEQIQKLESIGFKWDILEKAFQKGLQETLKYKEEHGGDPNAPAIYDTPEGYHLGAWQDYIRQTFKNNDLNPDRIKMLEDIGFKWKLADEPFEKGFKETLKYKEKFDNPNSPALYKTPEGYRLGAWQDGQRQRYKKGKMVPERAKRFEAIRGWKWDFLEIAFEKGLQETLQHKEEFGNPNAETDYVTQKGYRLGLWQVNQRRLYKTGKLDQERTKRLEAFEGWKWVLREPLNFERGYQETLKYMDKTEGNPNAPQGHKTSDGFNLGNWQAFLRRQYRKGELAGDYTKMLEKIGFIWNPFEEAFEERFKEALKYKGQFGTPNVPKDHKTIEVYRLYNWQQKQRRLYRINRLSPERAKRLSDIGFKWKLEEDAFEKGFQETLIYRDKSGGNPNANQYYIAPSGYKLGSWQSRIRQRYRDGHLASDKAKRLEEIGFKWKFRGLK